MANSSTLTNSEDMTPKTYGNPIPMEPDVKQSLSFFEFWPGWVMYIPVATQWIILSLRYRSLTLPFLANPDLTLSGMTGVGKSELMIQATGRCKATILPWIVSEIDSEDPQTQADKWIANAAENGITLPFVCKPDIGCRGFGVKLIKNAQELANNIKAYPKGTAMVCQKLASWEPEVGIFYVKDPVSGQGNVVSMTAKFLPRVTGDGKSTLGELIENDDRAGQLRHQYYERHKKAWDTVPANGQKVQLVFSASHSKGSIFRDACKYITPELNQAVAAIMDDLPNFYYGRLDVKYADLESLQKGETLEIVEINAASSESTHIWDRNTSFGTAIKTLMWQYRTLFNLGAFHRKNGRKTPGLKKFLHHWRIEKNLSQYYPYTD